MIVGAGPVGLSLALGLARHGIRSVVFEKNERTSRHSKAPGIQPRTLEIFRQWGVFDSVRAEGTSLRKLEWTSAEDDTTLLALDLNVLEAEMADPMLLILEQSRTEDILLQAVRETGLCDVRFEHEVVSVEALAGGVEVAVRADGEVSTLKAGYAVGCDGASSTVREQLGFSFDGFTYSMHAMLADVRMEDERDTLPSPRLHLLAEGFHFAIRLRPGLWRIVALVGRGLGEDLREEISRAEVVPHVEKLLGPGAFELVWASPFRIHHRSAPRFRAGRVLLAGDAAHVHSPAGAQGMNAGIQDAHNLAWKLAYALHEGNAERLLASYDQERREVVVGDITPFTDAITRSFVLAPRWIRQAFIVLLSYALRLRPVQRWLGRRVGMLSLRAGSSALLQEGTSAAGKRLPNVMLADDEGERTRIYDLMGKEAALLFLGEEPVPVAIDVPICTIHISSSSYRDPSGLLQNRLGIERGVALIRPDHLVAWASAVLAPNNLARAVRFGLGLGAARRTVQGERIS